MVLAGRLVELGLVKRYPVLLAVLSFGFVRGAVQAYLLRAGKELLNAYDLVYWVTQPVVWALYFLLILELYSRMLEGYPGVRRLGRVVMLSALAAVTLACCIVIVLDERAGFDHYPLLSYLVLQHRTIFLSLSGLTLLLLLFVAHYGIAVSRNVWTLCL